MIYKRKGNFFSKAATNFQLHYICVSYLVHTEQVPTHLKINMEFGSATALEIQSQELNIGHLKPKIHK